MTFTPLVDRSIGAVQALEALEVGMPDDFGRQTVRDTVMTTHRWVLPGQGELRAVSIEGRKVHIVSVFLWPASDRDAPAFAMEFVVFGPRPIVAVIDVMGFAGPSSAVAAAAILDSAHRRHPFQPGDDPPPWYVDCRSGHDFFVRPADLSVVRRLEDAHHDVFGAVLDCWRAQQASEDPAAHAERLAHYKAHHQANSPGRPFLERSFGTDWTERYLGEVFA